MADDIRNAVSSDLAHAGPGADCDEQHGPADDHTSMRGDDTARDATKTDMAMAATITAANSDATDATGTDTTGTTDTANTTDAADVLDALESLRALDTDRRAVNGRLVTATTATWNAALMGGIMAINAAVYWFLGWTVLGEHGAFTWTDYWLYVGGAVLMLALSAALTAYGQRRSGIGMWNGRLFWPDKRLMRDGRYRRTFTSYLAFVVSAPIAALIIGTFCAPWWPVVALAPICGFVTAWLCRRQIGAYARIITASLAPEMSHDATTPHTPDASSPSNTSNSSDASSAPAETHMAYMPDAPHTPRSPNALCAPDEAHRTRKTHGTEAGHDRG